MSETKITCTKQEAVPLPLPPPTYTLSGLTAKQLGIIADFIENRMSYTSYKVLEFDKISEARASGGVITVLPTNRPEVQSNKRIRYT